jgi:hypothetical protein
VSLTPIYDELREHRDGGGAQSASVTRRSSLRLLDTPAGGGTVENLADRRGLGGRHRRPTN